MCKVVYLSPSLEYFLYFYLTQPRDPITWLSVVSKLDTCLLGVYSKSFKKFKNGFFRVIINFVNDSHFFDENDNKKISFYWTENPLRYKE